ncbi:MAG: ferredoxin family protein [Anaerolineales bacterium]|jgi:ferredoxin|nr:ferredoxin family protein [Anaerolineales bacterium]
MSTKPGIWSSLLEHVELAKSLRKLEIHFDASKCIGIWQCYEVCPIGCWTPEREQRKVIFHNPELCIACGACVLQCPEDAISLKVPDA